MQYTKNKFLIFFIANIFLILFIFLLAIPASKFLKEINLDDNEFVEGQIIINPDAISPQIIDRIISINFKAEVDSSLEWKFETLQNKINLKIGENKIIKYKGENLSNKEITSTAIFTASPKTILPYLIKTECFCFSEQTLQPGESKIFTMVFYLDPALDNEKGLKELKELVFTYSFSEYKS